MATDPWAASGIPAGVDVTGFAVEARDGELGTVDEASSELGSSYLVVETGSRLFGKKVLIPAGTVEQVDGVNRRLSLKLNKEEIKQAPEFATDQSLDEPARRILGAYYLPALYEANRETLRRLIDEVWTQGNLSVLAELVGSDYLRHDPALPEPLRGREALAHLIGTYRTAFPDLALLIVEFLADGDKLVYRWSGRATHQASFAGMAATGKVVELEGTSIVRLVDGRISEEWACWDRARLLSQLGLLPRVAVVGWDDDSN